MANIEIIPFSSQPIENLPQSIPNFEVNTYLTSNSYIEFFAYNVFSYPEQPYTFAEIYDYKDYTVLNDGQSSLTNEISTIILNPTESALVNQIINNTNDQDIIITYNFYDKKIGSFDQRLYISEISSDRTELRLDSIVLSTVDILNQTSNFISEREGASYFVEFYLNFGSNRKVLGINLLLDNDDISNPTLLVKLNEPLSLEFDLNSSLWIVTLIENPISYKLTIPTIPIITPDTQPISGPNFNLDLKDQVNNSTLELSYIDILSSPLTSSLNQLNSILEETQLDINIDYTDFSNFIHFSSAQTRLENFYYKAKLLEQYSSSISILSNSPSGISGSIALYESKISNIITNFDGYEYYLYYESGSWAWPKLNTEPPYQLASINSPQVISWLGNGNEDSPLYSGILASASIYDGNNRDELKKSIPEYLRDDPDNEPYELFVDMVAQHYDSVWVYIKDVINKYDADNRLNFGISRDLVADAIRDFGVKLYQNNFSNEDLFTAFLGLTPEGGLFPFPNITGSLPTPSGFEYIDNFISASNDYMPLDDVNKSLYKRIYHNLPYLLKSKGTLPGLRALITSYGIPDTILRINEYGGKDKINLNDWDYWQNEFNYSFYTEGSNWVSSSFSPINSSWNNFTGAPESLMFRFKNAISPYINPINNVLTWDTILTNWDNTPYVWNAVLPTPSSQSLWSKQFNASHITLNYTGSGNISGSYSGSIVDPYYQYATLTFYPSYASDPTISASLYLPFFDGGWWSVMVNATPSGSGNNIFELYAANKIYEGGENDTRIGFIASSSVVASDSDWVGYGDCYFASGSTLNGNMYNPFSGSLQEIRYYVNPISESVFKDYTMNPYSIEGNSTNSAPNELLFRAPLGGELYTGSISIHPKITGSWIATQSFVSNSDFYFDQNPEFIPNREYFFYDQPIAGIKNTISDKIRIENNVIPEGDTLSPFMSLSQMANISQSYTQNINYLEVAFSPTNEINEDIMDQIGSFNIGEYIGDPRLRSSSAVTYPDLDKLRNEYFQKYISNYNLTDFIRLIKFFDNSLFKMIRDFVPARTSLASGIVVKQHLLERNKYPQPQVDIHSTIAYQASGSSPNISNNIPFTFQNIIVSGTLKPTWNGYKEGTVENFEGGTGGVFESFNSILNTSQSWLENYLTTSGSVVILHDSQDEFYNGEFSGSNILISNGILNEAYPPTFQAFDYKQVHYYGTSSIEDAIFENNFLNKATTPQNGEILFFNKADLTVTPFPIILQTKYLKISKFDCNGNDLSIPLATLENIIIYNPIVGQNITYSIININEKPSFYLYETSELYTPSLWPNQVLNYYVSSSKSTLTTFIPIQTSVTNYNIETGNILGYFNSTQGVYTLGNTPNTPLLITASFTVSQSGVGSSGTCSIAFVNPISNDITDLSTFQFSPSYTGTNTLSASYYGIQGDMLALTVKGGINCSLTDASFLVTQSRAISSSACQSVIFEPYITSANFYNSDENALLNNAFNLRDSTDYLDVDYSRGIMTPVNFQQLINKTATKAKVQDSNYTTLRHIIPRYLGSKSTSQFLNKWTPLDNGTFGKLPTVENLKAYVAYGFMDGSWIPERMNASSFTIKYLIDQDGNILTPNLSQISLPIVQQNFPTGDRFRYSSILPQTNPGGAENQFRNIIRGGYRIEPILYTQIGAQPGASWATGSDVISFTNIIPADQGTVTDVSGKYGLSTTLNYTGDSIVTFPSLITGTGLTDSPPSLGPIVASSSYEVPIEVIDEGINLSIGVKLLVNYNNPSTSTYNFDSLAVTIKRTTPSGNSSILFQKWINSDYSQFNGIAYPNALYTNTDYTIYVPALGEENLSIYEPVSPLVLPGQQQGFFTIPSSVLGVGDKITVEVFYPYSGTETLQIFPNSSFIINQYPIALPSIDILAPYTPNTLWGYPDPTNYPYIITSSNAGLCQAYGNPKIKQVNISGSGFNPTQFPFLLDVGDEFRFEGREDYTFEIKKIYAPQDEEDNYQIPRIFPTGSIEVHFSRDLPVSASVNSFNLDHFLIRKYTVDPTQIIFEGFRPENGAFPNSFVITPEYVIPQLDKNADEYVKILTEKGLIN